MKHSSALTGPLALVFAGGLAMGQTCPFTITHDADSLVTACTEVSTGVWDLSLSITDTDYPEVTVIVNDLPVESPLPFVTCSSRSTTQADQDTQLAWT